MEKLKEKKLPHIYPHDNSEIFFFISAMLLIRATMDNLGKLSITLHKNKLCKVSMKWFVWRFTHIFIEK